MNCKQFEKIELEQTLGDFQQGLLPADQHAQIERHLVVCNSCYKQVQLHSEYRRRLRTFMSPAPAPGVLAKLLHRAKQQAVQQRVQHGQHKSFVQGFAMASLAAVLVVGVMQFYPQGVDEIRPEMEQSRSVAIGNGDIVEESAVDVFRDVTLVINVPIDMPEASLALNLPDAVELDGFYDMRKIQWTVDLIQGANTLTLPISLLPEADSTELFYIEATIAYNNQEKNFQIPINFTAPKQDRQGSLLLDPVLNGDHA